jgi:hypothetical protein
MPCASNQCISASQLGPSASRTVARPFIFRQRGTAVNAVQITSDVHTPARCDALNISHLAKDLKCCRQPSPLAVTDLCRACSALASSEFKRGRLLFEHCTPAGSDQPRERSAAWVGWAAAHPMEVRRGRSSLQRLQLPQPRILRHEADV